MIQAIGFIFSHFLSFSLIFSLTSVLFPLSRSVLHFLSRKRIFFFFYNIKRRSLFSSNHFSKRKEGWLSQEPKIRSTTITKSTREEGINSDHLPRDQNQRLRKDRCQKRRVGRHRRQQDRRGQSRWEEGSCCGGRRRWAWPAWTRGRQEGSSRSGCGGPARRHPDARRRGRC